MRGGAGTPERGDCPNVEGQPLDQAECVEKSKRPNECGRDYRQRDSPVKQEAEEQATQVD